MCRFFVHWKEYSQPKFVPSSTSALKTQIDKMKKKRVATKKCLLSIIKKTTTGQLFRNVLFSHTVKISVFWIFFLRQKHDLGAIKFGDKLKIFLGWENSRQLWAVRTGFKKFLTTIFNCCQIMNYLCHKCKKMGGGGGRLRFRDKSSAKLSLFYSYSL